MDELGLTLFGIRLSGKPGDLVLKLGDPFSQLILLPQSRLASQIEQALLAGDCPGNVGIALPSEQLVGEIDRVLVVAFGFEASVTRCKLVQTFENNGQVGTRDGVIEADQD